MAISLDVVNDYEWFKVADKGAKILALSLDPSCVWEWTLSDGDPDEEEVGIEHVSYVVYLNWKAPLAVYFRKVKRDFKDVKDEPSWYKHLVA